MSEEKKTSWGKAYDVSVSQGPKQAAPAMEGAAASTPVTAAAPADSGGSEDRPRGRSQHVLPGILGKQLRAAYGELLNAPIPDSITELITKLEQQEAEKAAAAKPRDEEEGSK